MNFIRSVIFFIFYIIMLILLGIIMTPFYFIKNKKLASYIAIKWNEFLIYSMKYICGIKYKVEGLENLPEDRNYIVVSKHESAWETYFYLPLFKSFNGLCTSFVLKQELLWIPIFGWGLKVCGNIAINRNLGIESLKKTIDEAKKTVLGEKRNLVIFPQGTRTPIDADTTKYPYKVGFLAIAKELKLDLIPVAINTGKFWAKKQFCKKPGEVIIRILPPIPFSEIENVNKRAVLKNIENIIETNSKELL